jgi:CBS domain containing-hemolysin-like protein
MNALAILVLLIFICGFFALAEMALASSRRSRLQLLVDAGNQSASRALRIKSMPSRFIAATQTGLTAASLLAGIFGESALSGHVERFIAAYIPLFDPVRSELAITTTVVVVTAFAIVFGEIVPKRTIDDLFRTMAGDMMPGADDPAQSLAVQRDDGSWLLDGLLPIDQLQDKLGLIGVGEEAQGLYHTVGGFVVAHMGKIPKRAEKFRYGEWQFEVVDMDHNRVDEVLVTRVP